MKKLLKQYGLNSDMQYFQMIADSFINGQRGQAIDQFKALPKIEKRNFLKSVTGGQWDSHLQSSDVARLIDNL